MEENTIQSVVTVAKINRGELHDLLKAISITASRDITRKHLNCVRVEITKGTPADAVMRLVSTDGHRLTLLDHALVNEPEAAFTGEFSLETIERAIKVLKAKKADSLSDVEITVTAPGITPSGATVPVSLVVAGVVVPMPMLDGGSFPPYDKVIPKKQDPSQVGPTLIGLSATYLGDLASIVKLLPTKSMGVAISIDNQNAPARFDWISGATDCVHVLMPMRI